MAGVRIATWNVNGLRARIDFVRLWLQARQPDVVGLQELKMEESQFPYELFSELGYHAVVHGQKSWNGVAILSREPAELLVKGLAGQEEFGSRLITARVGGLDFTTVYCPNGKSVEHADYPKKLAWFESLQQQMAPSEGAGRPAVLGGDFNIVPTGMDSWNEAKFKGQIFHTDAERERYQAVLGSGWADLFRELHPEEKQFSWWDYRGGAFHRKMGLRIDFLLGSSNLIDRLESVEIDREFRKKQDGLTASDHAPVLAELRL